MYKQSELDLGDTNYTNQETDQCLCGCGHTTAPFDTNPQTAGSRPFVSQEGLKIWLADWSCVPNATAALMRNLVAKTVFKSCRTNTLSV